MSNHAKVILVIALLLGNGYLLMSWLKGASETNDVGRQWIRIIIPGMMVIFSLGIAAIVWVVDRIVRSKRQTGIKQPAAHVQSEGASSD